jgi:tRNA threonylcarbamoyladenosine biosynthesis protein TsaE
MQKIKINLTQAENRATKMASALKGGEIIALIGELGSGKTTFTKSLGKALGITRSIPSPTFVMMQEFVTKKLSHTDSKKPLILYHLDLYRTKNFAEVESLGITEWWGHPETVTVIEWADKISNHLPKNTIYIYLTRDAKLTNQ